MANRPGNQPNFNTPLKHSSRKKRLLRRKRERVVALAIITVIFAIVLSLAIFLVCFAVDAIKTAIASKPNDTQLPAGDISTQSIVFDKIPYSNTAVHVGELIVVNEHYAYDFSANSDLSAEMKTIFNNRVMFENTSNTYMVNGNNKAWKLHTKTLSALNDMMHEYYRIFKDGSTSVSSAYRSFEDQEALNSSVEPGFSDHHTGYCVALMDQGTGIQSDHWIFTAAHRYGLIQRYPDVKESITGVSDYGHCFRYVGVAHATYIKENNLCLEEYISLVQTHYTADNRLAITGADGNRYEVYYIPASNSDLTTVSVPKNYQYTVSGDNIGGFIVTVNLSAPVA